MSHFIEISKLLAEVAPTLSTAFLGPYATIALHLVSRAIGAAAKPEDVKTALSQSSENWLDAIKNLESTHSSWLSMLSQVKLPSKVTIHLELEFPAAS